jgi:hypothetical protein
LVEAELRLGAGGIAETCLHRVIKTNNRAFPIGLVLENPVFRDYLARLGSSTVATAETIAAEARDREAAPVLSVVPPPEASTEDALAALLAKVERYGFSRENLVTVALRDYGKPLLTDLTAPEIAALDGRIEAAAQKRVAPAAPAAPRAGSRK